MNITIAFPSRGRPYLAKRMLDSCYEMAGVWNRIQTGVYLNKDDPMLDAYQGMIPAQTKMFIGTDGSPAFGYNYITQLLPADVYVLAGDDCFFTTKSWEVPLMKLQEKYPDGIWCAAFHDGKEDGAYPHLAVGAGWVNALDYFVNPIFFHWYVDSYTVDLAKALGRFFYLKDVVLQHDKLFNTQRADETVSRIRDKNWKERDAYVRHIAQRYFLVDLKILREAMNDKS